jgi:hypothetical protein
VKNFVREEDGSSNKLAAIPSSKSSVLLIEEEQAGAEKQISRSPYHLPHFTISVLGGSVATADWICHTLPDTGLLRDCPTLAGKRFSVKILR